MNKWEYKIEAKDNKELSTYEAIEKYLNEQGKKEWQLVSNASYLTFIFKRELK